jgi:hypothetical protein
VRHDAEWLGELTGFLKQFLLLHHSSFHSRKIRWAIPDYAAHEGACRFTTNSNSAPSAPGPREL